MWTLSPSFLSLQVVTWHRSACPFVCMCICVSVHYLRPTRSHINYNQISYWSRTGSQYWSRRVQSGRGSWNTFSWSLEARSEVKLFHSLVRVVQLTASKALQSGISLCSKKITTRCWTVSKATGIWTFLLKHVWGGYNIFLQFVSFRSATEHLLIHRTWDTYHCPY